MNPDAARAAEVLLPAAVAHVETIGQGHINTTMCVDCADDSRWCLQWLNPTFADQRLVMANVDMVVSQLRRTGHRTLDFAVVDGRPWFVDDDGGFWRAYRWLEGMPATDHRRPDWPGLLRMVGRFTAALADLDDSQVATVVDRFHDPVDRWRLLEESIDSDAAGRVESCAAELADLRALAEEIWVETQAGEWTHLPRQVVHNDTKLANVIVDDDGAPVALIDLDTVMMGSPLNDLGEFVRGCPFVDGSQAGERLARLALAFAAGLERPLSAPEWDGLATAGAVMSFENAVRAMTDHLDGDRYYDLGPGVNLGRYQRHSRRAEQLLAMAPSAREALTRLDRAAEAAR